MNIKQNLTILSTLAISAFSLNADHYTFEGDQGNLGSLESMYKWDITNNLEEDAVQIAHKNLDAWLKIGGASHEAPAVEFPLEGGKMRSGKVKFTYGHSSSFSNAKLTFLDGNTELFMVNMISPDKVVLEGAMPEVFDKALYEGLKMSTVGSGSDPYNKVVVELAWKAGKVSELKGSITQPESVNPVKLDESGLDLGGFLSPGTPDRVRIETGKHDHPARYVLIYDLQITK